MRVSPYRIGEKAAGGGEGRERDKGRPGKKSRERRLIAKVDMIITRAIMKCPTTLSLSRED